MYIFAIYEPIVKCLFVIYEYFFLPLAFSLLANYFVDAIMGIRENIRREIGVQFRGNLSLFAKAAGISSAYLNEILNGKRRFNEDFLKKAAATLGVDTYQLFAETPLVPYPQVREEHARYGMSADVFETIKFFDNPLSLGPGTEISEIPPDDYLPFLKKHLPRGYKSDPDRIIAYSVAGISMKPTINSGSIVWIDRQDVQPKEGEVYAFWLKDHNSVTIKRLVKIQKQRYCIVDGDNRNEEDRKTEELRDYPMVIDCRDHDDEDHPWPIRGRVIWILNRLIEKPNK